MRTTEVVARTLTGACGKVAIDAVITTTGADIAVGCAETSSGFADFLAAELRRATLRVRLIENAIITAEAVLNSRLDRSQRRGGIAERARRTGTLAPSSTSPLTATTWWSS